MAGGSSLLARSSDSATCSAQSCARRHPNTKSWRSSQRACKGLAADCSSRAWRTSRVTSGTPSSSVLAIPRAQTAGCRCDSVQSTRRAVSAGSTWRSPAPAAGCVVSSFTHHDMPPDWPTVGPRLLRRFLEFASNGGHLNEVGKAAATKPTVSSAQRGGGTGRARGSVRPGVGRVRVPDRLRPHHPAVATTSCWASSSAELR